MTPQQVRIRIGEIVERVLRERNAPQPFTFNTAPIALPWPPETWEIVFCRHIGPACAAAFQSVRVNCPKDAEDTYRVPLSETVSLLAQRAISEALAMSVLTSVEKRAASPQGKPSRETSAAKRPKDGTRSKRGVTKRKALKKRKR